MNIDVGIITIKQEEFTAITSRLEGWAPLCGYKHLYIHQSIPVSDKLQYNVAVARCLEPGTGCAHSLAADMIEELNPTWLFLVGIAGGVPAPEYSLGDVLLCTRLYDFSVCCVQEGTLPTFSTLGGPIHPKAKKLLEILPAYKDHLEAKGWNSPSGSRKERPEIDFNSPSFAENLYGDESWQHGVTESLKQNFTEPRKPKYYLGPTGSSDILLKSASFLKVWLGSARGLTTVEMELAGVYLAVEQCDTPVLAIRSLSDIVGYRRSFEWTLFACESAASFAICLIQSGILAIDSIRPKVPTFDTPLVKSLDGSQISQDDTYLSFPNRSPFYPFGTIPLDHPGYIIRESDRQLERFLISHSFICLHGNFCSGKSSLLIRVPHLLSEGWNVFRPRLELYQSGRKGTLEKSFFVELQEKYEAMHDWISLSEFLKKSKLALLIDEIQKCSPNDAKPFIEKLLALADQAPSEHIRVVLTINTSLDIYIQSIGLVNPKYRNCWEVVELTRFNEVELTKLLNLFPKPVALSLQENLSKIQERTSMEPNAVQQLCDGLWKSLRGKTILKKDIGQQVQSYLEDYRKA